MEEPVQDLVQRALAGDRAALRQLFANVISPAVERRLSWRLAVAGADRSELLDHVQEVLVHLLSRDAEVLRRWDPQRGALESYVVKVAENHMISRLRKKPPPRPTEDLEDQVDDREQPVETAAFSHLVRRLVRELNESDAALFRAVFLEELSPEEAAAQLGISREAAYKRIQRLRDRLGEMLSNPKAQPT
ncbi:MAG: sigma-70 family RNA polymerase sigma factor [Myxococcales bacterium]|nr:sigma-70 family RNA polymerase sigma factor [Myxococcales bacterium]HRC58383.1 sigma-70 family RNA polymerase sigma factor [Kofleriaceae bacterium]